MQIAFISQCITFYNTLSSSLNQVYPDLSFFHFRTPEMYQEKRQPTFSHLIIKLNNDKKNKKFLSIVKAQNPDIVIIGLTTDENVKPRGSEKTVFNYLFTDMEISEKLNVFFHNHFKKASSFENPEALEIEILNQKYIGLPSILAECLYLISIDKTAPQIASDLNKSTRTIEGYIIELRKKMGINSKEELAAAYSKIFRDATKPNLAFKKVSKYLPGPEKPVYKSLAKSL